MKTKSFALWRIASHLLLFTPFATTVLADDSSNYSTKIQHAIDTPFARNGLGNNSRVSAIDYAEALQDLYAALEVMQTKYFTLWVGDWPDAIDWTGTVINTYLTAALSTFSGSLEYIFPSTLTGGSGPGGEAQQLENKINKYFSQGISYYWAEDILAIRGEAYDDMQWVVLDWLDGIRFIDAHSKTHYPLSDDSENTNGTDWWYARQFIPLFAHRSRVFYELAEKGWNDTLCGGGMLWNPVGLPYKNTVTNQLFITASIDMYLYFPGDDIDAPFVSSSTQQPKANTTRNPRRQAPQVDNQLPTTAGASIHDPRYLDAAIKAYDWLVNINMTNNEGLYVDGYHISGLDTNSSNTICDERDETVWTYNQGIILSGLRGLWDATGNATYLKDGHALVQNVIRATGWILSSTRTPRANSIANRRGLTFKNHHQQLPERQVSNNLTQTTAANELGTKGILTERCDPFGDCTQDAQTFKGIFFHHFIAFCAPLSSSSPPETAQSHAQNCTEYVEWVVANSEAALSTRDAEGRFGAWWGAGWDGTGEDPNARGRGRTVETQGGGVAVVRGAVEFLKWYRGGL